ncbi:MAG: glutamate--tRNA ligase [Clostridia bacterium]|nr:glutamate--tRNA ligase [Clostridia bacterium]
MEFECQNIILMFKREKVDNKKLANLLFPNVEKDAEYYLKNYRKRNIKAQAEVTRIAPSPTGYLHIGSVYGAFIDKLIAHHSGGIFFMRLEDTDAKREVENAGDIAFDMLCHFDLCPDEGYFGSKKPQVGEYGDYVQSKRKDIYIAFAKYLVEKGRAYPCFCEKSQGKDDILKRRQEELENNFDIEEKDVCRDMSFEQIEENLSKKMPFAIRLKSNGNPEKTFKFYDEIKGEREIRQNAKDAVILKSNFTPPYSLAHVVDDTLMGTTLVVRGEEWYPSLSMHLELFEALSLTPPKYAHTPVVCKMDDNGNKRKLSKRKDKEADTRFFIEKGYPVKSVLEYLLNLINSNFEDWRRQNQALSFYDFPFSISKIGSNNPMFDFQKLDDCSKQVISKFKSEEIYEETLKWAEEFDASFAEILKNKKEFCIKLFSIDRFENNPRKDIAKWSEVKGLYDYMFLGIDGKKLKEYDFDEKLDKKDIFSILKEYSKTFNLNDDKQTWFNKIRDLSARFGFCVDMKEYRKNPTAYKGSVADVSGIVRVAMTQRRNSPDLYYLMELLGKNEVQKRLDNVIKLLEN